MATMARYITLALCLVAAAERIADGDVQAGSRLYGDLT